MPIEDIVLVTITTDTARVSRAGFGTPLIAAYHTHWVDRVRTYSASSALTAMADEGFATTDPAYLAMQAIISQNPRPRNVKIGRRDDSWTQIVRLIPSETSNTAIYSGEIDGIAFTFTSDGTATLAEICTGVAAAINATAVLVTADGTSGTHVVCTSDNAARTHSYLELVRLTQGDFTVEADIADDLNAIRIADPDWYGLVLDSAGTTEIADAAAWCETQRVLFVQNTSDSDVASSSTTDLGSDLEALSYSRTALIYHEDTSAYAGAAWLGKVLPLDPGSETWAYKTLAGVATSDLTPTVLGQLDGKKVNHYTSIANVPITRQGQASSGQFLDITRFIDFLTARIEERVFTLIANSNKLPYTDASVDLVKGEIMSVLLDGVAVGGLVAGSISVDAPLVADVDPVDRANRLLPDVSFGGQLAGAIHTVEIQGNLTI